MNSNRLVISSKKLSPEKKDLINEITTAAANRPEPEKRMTIRNMFYMLVGKHVINSSAGEYVKIVQAVKDGRSLGIIPWDLFYDEGRKFDYDDHFRNPKHALESLSRSYLFDKRLNQAYRPEVWIEKAALAVVVKDTCKDLDVGLLACKGYPSLTSLKLASDRFIQYRNVDGQEPIVFFLGDHDPSGFDIFNKIQIDIKAMTGEIIDFRRIGITKDYAVSHNLKSIPAKASDSRTRAYVQRHESDSCWELDAMDPDDMCNAIIENVGEYTNDRKFKAAAATERKHRLAIARLAKSLK